MTLTSAPIAIVGNGGAAAEAILALRANGYEQDIHLFADNAHAPYNPMLGTYLVGGRLPVEHAFPFGNTAAFYDANRIDAHLNSAVTRLDAESRELVTAAGNAYRYDLCLVASGARPAVPPIAGLREALAVGATGTAAGEAPRGAAGASATAGAGNGLRRVFTLQSLEDALALKQAVDGLLEGNRSRGAAGTPPRAAVVGASFAGVKIAEVLHQLGFRVVLVEREASILPLAAHPDTARILEAHLLKEGYELRLGAALAGVRLPETFAAPESRIVLDFGALPGAADPGGAGGTACEDSAAQDVVDLLVVCTGNRPALGFLTPGQIDIGAGILVNDQMQSSVPTLYAAGDVAQGKNLLSGRHDVIGLWSSARYQGRAAGRSMCGVPTGYAGGIPHNITHVGDVLFASMGCVDDYDRVNSVRNGASWRLELWREGRMVGLNLIDDCLSAGVTKQAFSRAAMGAGDTEATWTSFRN